MKCLNCSKGVLIRQYRVFNAKYLTLTSKYFDSLELAENYYEEKIKSSLNEKWILDELLICNDCDYVSEKVLKGENIK